MVRSSIDRVQLDQIGIGQLHWSTANYAPLQERALWDGLVAMYDKVTVNLSYILAKRNHGSFFCQRFALGLVTFSTKLTGISTSSWCEQLWTKAAIENI